MIIALWWKKIVGDVDTSVAVITACGATKEEVIAKAKAKLEKEYESFVYMAGEDAYETFMEEIEDFNPDYVNDDDQALVVTEEIS